MNFNFKSDFKNKTLIETAFIHRSFLNENRNKNLESNERLEFLGDAVLELIVSLYLYESYPKFTEGQLTNLRSQLVQTKTLSIAAVRLGFGELLKLSRGEKAGRGHENPSILADTFEAVVGAIYQSEGFVATYKFVLKNLIRPAQQLFNSLLPQDYKSCFQELIQSQGKPTPTYNVIESIGPDHNKIFKIAVYINKRKIAEGVGKSKQEAEQAAAKKALDILKITS